MATLGNTVDKPTSGEAEDLYVEASNELVTALAALPEGKAGEVTFPAATYTAERKSLARAANRAGKTLRRVRKTEPVRDETAGTVTELLFLGKLVEFPEGVKRGRPAKASK